MLRAGGQSLSLACEAPKTCENGQPQLPRDTTEHSGDNSGTLTVNLFKVPSIERAGCGARLGKGTEHFDFGYETDSSIATSSQNTYILLGGLASLKP